MLGFTPVVEAGAAVLSPDGSLLVAGLLLMLMSWVWREGAALREEVEATI